MDLPVLHPQISRTNDSNWSSVMAVDNESIRGDENEGLRLIREHRQLFERLARSDLPIREDALRGLAYLDASENDEK